MENNILPQENAAYMEPNYAPVQSEQRRTLTLSDAVTSLVCLGLGFVFTHFVCGYAGGLWGGIMWLLFGTTAAVYVKIKHLPVTRAHIAVFGIAMAFCFVPLFSANSFINTLAAWFTFLLMVYIGTTLNGAELFGEHFARDMANSVLIRPFSRYGDGARSLGVLFRNRTAGKNIGFVLLGLIVALPLTFTVLALLMSSDGIFNDTMESFFSSIPKTNGTVILHAIMAVPVALYLFGMLSATCDKQEQYNDALPSYRIVPTVLGCTMVTPVCLFYLVYVVIQFRYITAAFGGTLPEPYSYSEYARRGFFELCVVAVINLVVIILMQCFMKRDEYDRKTPALKVYTTIISGFTLMLIASAISKMVLYISELGMTPLRIYTSWFMAVLAMIFVLVIIMQFVQLPVWKVLFCSFTVMMALLCFSNVDGMIADYNVSAYQSGTLERVDIDLLEELGDAAIIHVERLTSDSDRYVSERAKSAYERMTIVRDSRDSFAYFSFPRVM